MNIAMLFLMLLEPRRRAFEASTRDPMKAQKKILLEYVRRNCDTEYGRKYGFSGIRSIDDYRTRVPLTDYEAIRPYVDRMIKGERKILTRDDPVFFSTTSGTTSLPKFIPTTKYSEAKKARLLELWSYYIARDHPEILDGKVLAIISPETEGFTDAGIRYGAETGHGYRNLPPAVRGLYAIPPEVFEIDDYDSRYYSILRICMEQDITDIATINPNTIILLCQKTAKWQGAIIDDIEKGSISADFDIPDKIRRSLARRLKPNPARASRLRAILEEKKALLPKDFWPNMRLIECWKGGMMGLYLKELEDYFGPVPIRDMGCLSSEARSSIATSDEGAAGVLAINTNFYEFIPKEDAGKKDPRVLLCDEIKPGKEYFIIVTTPGGLYRYNIDDIVKVDSFFNKTPTIEFVQKGLDTASIAGEKLYESQVNEAVGKALEKHGLILEFICGVADAAEKRYIFLVEFASKTPTAQEKKLFLASIENGLRLQNKEYGFVRDAQLLREPALAVIQRGGFERFRLRRIAEGAHDSQFKAPELTADQAFKHNFTIDEVVTL